MSSPPPAPIIGALRLVVTRVRLAVHDTVDYNVDSYPHWNSRR